MNRMASGILPADKPGRVLPTLIVDSREQTPIVFTRLPSTIGTLTTGDYSFVGAEELFAIERKSIADLAACCTGDNRERFFREMHRLRGFVFKRLLVIGEPNAIELSQYPSRVSPQAVFATLAALEARYGVPVTFASTPDTAAARIESWAAWFARELVNTGEAVRSVV